jgi:hypothetical protein
VGRRKYTVAISIFFSPFFSLEIQTHIYFVFQTCINQSIVAADFHDTLFIWSGANCTAKRYDGIRDKLKTYLLEVSMNRFPQPELHVLEDGDSMSRRFTARLAPSHADPIDNQIVHFPALSTLDPAALEKLRSKFKFYDSKSDESFRTWFWSVASASNNSRSDGMSLCE